MLGHWPRVRGCWCWRRSLGTRGVSGGGALSWSPMENRAYFLYDEWPANPKHGGRVGRAAAAGPVALLHVKPLIGYRDTVVRWYHPAESGRHGAGAACYQKVTCSAYYVVTGCRLDEEGAECTDHCLRSWSKECSPYEHPFHIGVTISGAWTHAHRGGAAPPGELPPRSQKRIKKLRHRKPFGPAPRLL